MEFRSSLSSLPTRSPPRFSDHAFFDQTLSLSWNYVHAWSLSLSSLGGFLASCSPPWSFGHGSSPSRTSLPPVALLRAPLTVIVLFQTHTTADMLTVLFSPYATVGTFTRSFATMVLLPHINTSMGVILFAVVSVLITSSIATVVACPWFFTIYIGTSLPCNSDFRCS